MMSTHRTISFRLDERKLKALDELADDADRDRSYLLNEAVDNYLELQVYHLSLVREGLKAMAEGRTITADAVRRRIRKLTRTRAK
jgi:RHH-type transcriptional regulator, rel operon repressor / antitoxin RelB